MTQPTDTKYVIRSAERAEPNAYFVAWHSFTPFYGPSEKARRFDSDALAKAYAIGQLFSAAHAFRTVAVS